MSSSLRFVGIDRPLATRKRRRICVSGTMLEHPMHRAPDGTWAVRPQQAAQWEFTLSVRELARQQGWSVSTARRRIAAGVVPVLRRDGRVFAPDGWRASR
jgi:hypothetical protein